MLSLHLGRNLRVKSTSLASLSSQDFKSLVPCNSHNSGYSFCLPPAPGVVVRGAGRSCVHTHTHTHTHSHTHTGECLPCELWSLPQDSAGQEGAKGRGQVRSAGSLVPRCLKGLRGRPQGRLTCCSLDSSCSSVVFRATLSPWSSPFLRPPFPSRWSVRRSKTLPDPHPVPRSFLACECHVGVLGDGA
uniref:Uncharacterized protein n=1 Tax=Myotis myotis TaxID=51298 RepID=A0A7J7ZWH7_MYOMY|nr:hypothetical protein mMyoMyo1_009583 [Myotis myotis]